MHICGRASLGVVSVCFGAALALSGARASAKQAPSPASPSPPRKRSSPNAASLAIGPGEGAPRRRSRRNPGRNGKSGSASARSCAEVPCRRPDGRVPTTPPTMRPRRSRDRLSIGRGRRTPSGPHRRRASAEPHRVHQRHPRPVRTRTDSIDVHSQLPGDETADGSFDNFADVALDLDRASRALHVGRASGDAPRRRPPPRPTVEDVRGSAAHHSGRSAERGSAAWFARRHCRALSLPGRWRIPHQRRLQRKYQDYLKGMGWPQAARRAARRQAAEAIRGRRQGAGPARGASYAGDGEPGFAGAPEWESTCSSTATPASRSACPSPPDRAWSACRSCASCGSPRGLPQPLQRGRVITNDEVYMGYANVGSVQIGGPYSAPEERQRRETPSRRSRIQLPSARASGRDVVRRRKSCRVARLAYRRPVNEADVQTC